jgi:hypothetical protein
MSDTKEKALALVKRFYPECPDDYQGRRLQIAMAAIEQHEAFRQEVSDVVKAFNNGWANCRAVRQQDWEALLGFIIPAPTPDPLVEVLGDLEWNNNSPECAAELRAALEARGLEIKEKEQ